MGKYYLVNNKDGKKYYLMSDRENISFRYTEKRNTDCLFDEDVAKSLSYLFDLDIEEANNKLEMFVTTGAINKAYFVDINDSYLCIETYNELFEVGKFYNKGQGLFEVEPYYGCLDSISDSFKYFKTLSKNIKGILMKFDDLPF